MMKSVKGGGFPTEASNNSHIDDESSSSECDAYM